MVISDAVRVNTYTNSDQLLPRVTVLNDGSTVVVWYSVGQDGSGQGIYQQRFDASGTPLGAETRVNTYTTGDQYDATVTAVSGGGYVISWASDGEDGSSFGVYGRRYNACYPAWKSDPRMGL